jgi:hypothetical protein
MGIWATSGSIEGDLPCLEAAGPAAPCRSPHKVSQLQLRKLASTKAVPQRLSQSFSGWFCVFRPFVNSRYTNRNPTN